MKFLIMVVAVAASGALLVPTLAQARQHDEMDLEQVSATIRYNPRDLQAPDGVARFQKNVDATIRKMCSRGRENMPSLTKDTQQCIVDARQSIEPHVRLALARASNDR